MNRGRFKLPLSLNFCDRMETFRRFENDYNLYILVGVERKTKI